MSERIVILAPGTDAVCHTVHSVQVDNYNDGTVGVEATYFEGHACIMKLMMNPKDALDLAIKLIRAANRLL